MTNPQLLWLIMDVIFTVSAVGLLALFALNFCRSEKATKIFLNDYETLRKVLAGFFIHPVMFKCLSPSARLPSYAHAGDSGADIYSIEDVVIAPRSSAKIRTGIAAKIGRFHELQVRPRSGLQSRGIVAGFGTIDSGYRGEICVTLFNHTGHPYHVSVGDRIAQLVMATVCRMDACAVPEFPPDEKTDRGENGFGSTGK